MSWANEILQWGCVIALLIWAVDLPGRAKERAHTLEWRSLEEEEREREELLS